MVRLSVVVVAAALALAGCGADDAKPDAAPTPSSSASSSPSASPTAAQSSPAATPASTATAVTSAPAPAPDQPPDPGARRTLTAAQKAVVRANTGTSRTVAVLGPVRTVTVAHSKTKDLPAVCRRADLLFAAVGRAEMIKGDWVRPGATVIDVGINRVPGANGKSRIVGDVAYAECAERAGAITPVPGGVGPMTIACLLVNTVRAACAIAGLPAPAV